jgi:hypothetical protein
LAGFFFGGTQCRPLILPHNNAVFGDTACGGVEFFLVAVEVRYIQQFWQFKILLCEVK